MSAPEKDAFEAWIQGVYAAPTPFYGARNCYVDFPVHIAWQAWKAASGKLSTAGTGEGRDGVA